MKFFLTKRQIEVLNILFKEQTDIAIEAGEVYVGDEKTNYKLVNQLLRYCLLKDTSFSNVKRYEINVDGIKALKNGFVDLNEKFLNLLLGNKNWGRKGFDI